MSNSFLEWAPWPKDVGSLPHNEPLLVEIDRGHGPEFRVATMTKGAVGTVGIVGDCFHFDRKIIRWAPLRWLVGGLQCTSD